MAAVRALIDTVNELAQAPLRAGSRVWRGAGPGGWVGVGRTQGVAIELPTSPQSEYAQGNLEPPLEELLCDPMVHLVMRADRLDPADVRRTFHPERPTVS